jgi:hypothetical protein
VIDQQPQSIVDEVSKLGAADSIKRSQIWRDSEQRDPVGFFERDDRG